MSYWTSQHHLRVRLGATIVLLLAVLVGLNAGAGGFGKESTNLSIQLIENRDIAIPQDTPDRPSRHLAPATQSAACEASEPNGTTDNSGCVQGMVDAACRAGNHHGGGLVFLWPGHWKFHDVTVHCDGVHIEGAGPGNDSMAANAQSTSVDCSGMMDHCIQFIPHEFPARFRLRSGSVEGVRFVNSGGSGRILDFVQVEDGYVRDISMWEPVNGIRLYGVNAFTLTHIRQWGAKGIQYEITGDMRGKKANGEPCNLGDCSTRSDWVFLEDLYSTAASSSDFVYVHDQAFTVEANRIANENGRSGLKVRCAAGKPNLSYCPQQIIMTGFTVEYSIKPVDLSDFTWFRCVSCYMAGAGRRTDHIVSAQLTNYAQARDGAGGGVTIVDAQIYGAGSSCIYTEVTDVTITGSQIYGCNLANKAYAGVEFAAGTQHHVSDTTFCTSIGVAPTAMTGILVDKAASQVAITAPMFYGCTSGLVNNSAYPQTVTTVNSQGP
jgi:hypothetical protein